MAFQTNRADGVPPWKRVYDHIREKAPQIDDVFPHAELRQVAEADDEYYTVMSRVARECERADKRTLVACRGEGYRFTAGIRHVERGNRYRKRANRAMGRALQIISSADYGIMDAAGRQWADRQRNAVVALLSIVKQHDEKLIGIAEELRDVRESTVRSERRQAATEEQIADIERQLEELRRSRSAAA